jgi:hypothetical protein
MGGHQQASERLTGGLQSKVNSTVTDLVANQTGASKDVSDTCQTRRDSHSHEQVRTDINTCQKTTVVWDHSLSKFDMELWLDNENGERIKFQVEFAQNIGTRLEELTIAF